MSSKHPIKHDHLQDLTYLVLLYYNRLPMFTNLMHRFDSFPFLSKLQSSLDNLHFFSIVHKAKRLLPDIRFLISFKEITQIIFLIFSFLTLQEDFLQLS